MFQPMSTASPSAENPPAVGIIMGSDSDWPTMKAATVCERFASAMRPGCVSSPHPKDMAAYGESSPKRIEIIIAGAGGGHLPGMIASHTPLPVMAFRFKASPSVAWTPVFNRADARRIPVATVYRHCPAQAYWPYPYSDLRTPTEG